MQGPKRWTTIALSAVTGIAVLATVAAAHGPGNRGNGGPGATGPLSGQAPMMQPHRQGQPGTMGPGTMGPGTMGPGMMGGGALGQPTAPCAGQDGATPCSGQGADGTPRPNGGMPMMNQQIPQLRQ